MIELTDEQDPMLWNIESEFFFIWARCWDRWSHRPASTKDSEYFFIQNVW